MVLAVDHEACVGVDTGVGLAAVRLLRIRVILILQVAPLPVFRLGLHHGLGLVLCRLWVELTEIGLPLCTRFTLGLRASGWGFMWGSRVSLGAAFLDSDLSLACLLLQLRRLNVHFESKS